MRDPYGKTKAPYTNVSTYSTEAKTLRARQLSLSPTPLLSALDGPTSWSHWEMGIPGSWEPRRGKDPRRPGHSAASPGDEEDDSQRVGGDGEDVKSERGPEGDEGATEEHRHRHGTSRSQSQGT